MILTKINEKYTEEEIQNIIKKCINAAREIGINPATILGIIPYGSFNYNLTDKESDLDLYVIYIPNYSYLFNQISMEKSLVEKEQNTNFSFGEVHFKDIFSFLKQVEKGNLRFIELMFSSNYLFEKKFFKKFLDQTRYMYLLHNPEKVKKYITNYMSQKKYALAHPFKSKLQLIEKYGYDLKNYSHVLRMENFSEKYLILLDYLYKFGFNLKFNEHKFNPFLVHNNRQETINPTYLINLKHHNLKDFPELETVSNHITEIIKNIVSADFEINPFSILLGHQIKEAKKVFLKKCYYFAKGI